MEQPPPLSPQEVAELAGKEYAQLGQPQTVKVFGILHVVFALFGFLSCAWALFVALVGNPFLGLGPKTPAAQAQAQAQAALQERMLPATLASTALTLVIAGLMLTAGILLLKKRRSGLKWSNRYAWTSLAGKVVNVVMMFVFTVPAMKEMTDQMTKTTPMPGAFGGIMVASMVVGVLIACSYPVLTLIFLNKPATKTWFANQPD
jgi:hypothetical protein